MKCFCYWPLGVADRHSDVSRDRLLLAFLFPVVTSLGRQLAADVVTRYYDISSFSIVVDGK